MTTNIAHQCIPHMRVGLITCVTNGAGLGPGHTCIVLDGFVYTFERFLAGWNDLENSGWVKINNQSYLDQNTHRPVIIQELSPAVNASKVYEYISMSDYNDEDYILSGVCSQQAIQAISAGVGRDIAPSGADIPYTVYAAVRRSGFVSNTSYVFPTEGQGVAQLSAGLDMMTFYSAASHNRVSSPGILRW